MTLQLLAGVAVCFALTFSLFACILSGVALLKVLAMEKSTHSVQFMPVEDALKTDEWATSEDEVSKQNKLYKENLEETLPDFMEDKKIKSF